MKKKQLALTLCLGAAMVGGLFAQPAKADLVAGGEWIDLFDGETLFGWTQFGDSEWRVEDGAMVVNSGAGGWIALNAEFRDFELTARMRITGSGTAGAVARAPLGGHPLETGAAMVTIENQEGEGDWREVRIVAQRGEVRAEVDGEAVDGLEVARDRGRIGFQYHRYHRMRISPKLEVKDVRLRPLMLSPIFDGETLDGWNIIPDRASEFSVEDGALRVVDGPGQIETDGVYRDFLLQLDIYSNGDHLNSGVFYRGPKGQWWRGYEAQVRNQWIGDDRTRPVDYGTGGIYGVQEARKVVSSDYEWFTMTVVFSDNHQAVWVDGHLVADFFDTRPVNDGGDGKNGYVPEAGTIHLQGHDPATDLSFKNIHIQNYDE